MGTQMPVVIKIGKQGLSRGFYSDDSLGGAGHCWHISPPVHPGFHEGPKKASDPSRVKVLKLSALSEPRH